MPPGDRLEGVRAPRTDGQPRRIAAYPAKARPRDGCARSVVSPGAGARPGLPSSDAACVARRPARLADRARARARSPGPYECAGARSRRDRPAAPALSAGAARLDARHIQPGALRRGAARVAPSCSCLRVECPQSAAMRVEFLAKDSSTNDDAGASVDVAETLHTYTLLQRSWI